MTDRTSKQQCMHGELARADGKGPWYCMNPDCGFTLWPSAAKEPEIERLTRNILEIDIQRAKRIANLHRASDETSRDDAVDAAKWRAFRNCARIRVLGSAGFTRVDQYRFVTLEAWTQHDAHSSPEALKMLEEFVAVAQQCSSVEPTPELYTQEALDAAHQRTRERLATLKVDTDLSEKATAPAWDCACNELDCPYCANRNALNG